jgi:S-adenosylmethionine decarboxylase
MEPNDARPVPSFFEGTEKKVELIVDPSFPSLRALGDDHWRTVVEAAGAQVLSKIDNDACSAYLLSESSLFVLEHKVLMITCGRTRLTAAVDRMLDRVRPDQVRLLIYQRKNEIFPHTQPTSFFDDVTDLSRRVTGRAFQFGNEDEHHLYLFHLDRPYDTTDRDFTVEVLMYGIDSEVRRRFAPGPDADTADVRRESGLDGLLAGFVCDDHLFDPSGYSLNGIRGDEYVTLHVTPDEISSYVSLETNCCFGDAWEATLRRVLDVFRPRSFDLILWERGVETAPADCGYQLKESVTQDLTCGFRVRFQSYYRPALGERQAVELPIPSGKLAT